MSFLRPRLRRHAGLGEVGAGAGAGRPRASGGRRAAMCTCDLPWPELPVPAGLDETAQVVAGGPRLVWGESFPGLGLRLIMDNPGCARTATACRSSLRPARPRGEGSSRRSSSTRHGRAGRTAARPRTPPSCLSSRSRCARTRPRCCWGRATRSCGPSSVKMPPSGPCAAAGKSSATRRRSRPATRWPGAGRTWSPSWSRMSPWRGPVSGRAGARLFPAGESPGGVRMGQSAWPGDARGTSLRTDASRSL